jgi:soluble lytic murein transglycosylase-like protein
MIIILHFLLIAVINLLPDRISDASIFLNYRDASLTSDIKQEQSKQVPKAEKTVRNDLVQWVVNNSECSTKTAKEIVEAVLETQHPLLLLSIIKKESEFKPKAVSSSNCIGLGQISPIHIKELKEEGIINSRKDLTTIKGNVRSANYILKLKLRKSKNNVRKALLYYVGDTSRHDYASSVLKNYSSLKKEKEWKKPLRIKRS